MKRPFLRPFALAGLALAALAVSSACSGPAESRELEPSASLVGADELESYIGGALARYQVPGAAIAIVRGREVVYEGTFGVRGLDDPALVTPDTRFALASVTKSMTSAMLATLVDEGTLGWDTPVGTVLPGLTLSDPESMPELRLRHLLSHSSGVARQDLRLFIWQQPPTQLITSMRDMSVVAPPGSVFEYHDQMFAAAGFLAALTDGARRDDRELYRGYLRSMHDRLLSPIGMPRTTFEMDVVLADGDHARPHSYNGTRGAFEAVPIDFERFAQSTSPASSAWASVRDMEAFVMTELGGVAPDGDRVVSAESLEQTHRGVIPATDEAGGDYALGWREDHDRYPGMRAIHHDGDGLGFTSEVLLLPEADAGVVILTNRAEAQPFYRAVERFAIETLLGWPHAGDAAEAAEDTAWLGSVRELAAGMSPVSREQALPYIGSYEHGVRVSHSEQGFVLTTEFGDLPLAGFGSAGRFVVSGVMNGRFTARFDSDTQPMRLELASVFSEGASESFSLLRVE